MAVVAMVEPEIAEKIVPATTVTTASRPGTCRMMRSMPSITLMREAGVEQHLAHQDEKRNRRQAEIERRGDAVARDLLQPGLAAEKQDGADNIDRDEGDRDRHPDNSSTVEPPSRSSEAICQDMLTRAPLVRCRFQAAEMASSRRPISALASRCMRKKNSSATSDKGERQRRERPPFRRDQRLDVDRAGRVARHRDEHRRTRRNRASRPDRRCRRPIPAPRPAAVGSARKRMSTRICWPWRSSQGAASSVIR